MINWAQLQLQIEALPRSGAKPGSIADMKARHEEFMAKCRKETEEYLEKKAQRLEGSNIASNVPSIER